MVFSAIKIKCSLELASPGYFIPYLKYYGRLNFNYPKSIKGKVDDTTSSVARFLAPCARTLLLPPQ